MANEMATTTKPKNMNSIINVGLPLLESDCGFNLCAIDEHGSPITTQVWGGTKEAKECALDFFTRAASRWHVPIVHVFIRSHETETTYRFDREHIALLLPHHANSPSECNCSNWCLDSNDRCINCGTQC